MLSTIALIAASFITGVLLTALVAAHLFGLLREEAMRALSQQEAMLFFAEPASDRLPGRPAGG